MTNGKHIKPENERQWQSNKQTEVYIANKQTETYDVEQQKITAWLQALVLGPGYIEHGGI